MSIRLVRKVTFSAGHRYWLSKLTEDENRRLFGPLTSPFNHGHNYTLEAGFEGEIEPESGMVINIKLLDAMMDELIVDAFNMKSINDEVPHFADRSPSLENLLLFFRDQLAVSDRGFRIADWKGPALPASGFMPISEGGPSAIQNPKSKIQNPDIRLVSLRLIEMPELWAEWTYENGEETMTLTRTYEFAASHRLHAPDLSEERNLELYGKCANPSGHGHNYKLEVTVSGELDAQTGMIVDLMAVDAAVNSRIVDRYDHHHLNTDLPEFVGKVTTSEVVAQEIWKALEGHVPGRLERVRLFETDRSWFEIAR